MNTNEQPPEFESKLKIGAVARLTGLSVHTLRKWEERYNAVQPERTARGGRLYSRDDVKRLALIKRLTHTGTPLREITGASLEELEQAVQALADSPVSPARVVDSVRVAIAGDALPTLFSPAPAACSAIEVVVSGDSVSAIADAANDEGADLLVLELATVQAGAVETVRAAVRACGAKGAIVVYGFGSALTLDSLRRGGIALMRAPVDPGGLQRVALGLMQELGTSVGTPVPEDLGHVVGGPIPPPRFSGEVIARVSRISSSVRCECPRHLADLVFSLGAFERYSAECENLSPRDAALHHYLWQTAGHCRATFEEALARIAEAEGIDLEGEDDRGKR